MWISHSLNRQPLQDTYSDRPNITYDGKGTFTFEANSKGAFLWYIDGTFKLCRRPFQQLLAINAFVRNEDHAKQIPLVFVLMYGRKKERLPQGKPSHLTA